MNRLPLAADRRDAVELLSEKLVNAGLTYDALADAASAHRENEYNAKRAAVGVREAAVRRVAGPLLGAAGKVPG